MFEKVLIANRGEIAIRVMRACRELDIKSVAIYSDADASSLYTNYADESYPLGNPSPAKSYLNIEKIIMQRASRIQNIYTKTKKITPKSIGVKLF